MQLASNLRDNRSRMSKFKYSPAPRSGTCVPNLGPTSSVHVLLITMRSHQSYHNITTVKQLSYRWMFKEKSNQMYPVMGEKQMSKRVRRNQRMGSKVANFLKKSEHYITSSCVECPTFPPHLQLSFPNVLLERNG